MNHSDYMTRAFDAALSRTGITSPNPPVGAIVVKSGSIISEGGTQVCGGDHAEVCALNAAGDNAEGADLYVTLEPCCHHGKTPPCTDLIIRSGIRRVFIPLEDPNPIVSGKGIETLRNAGIEVNVIDSHADHARQIMRPFFTLIEKKRPHVMYKTAMTADGFTASSSGDSKWVSSSLSRLVVHRYRSLVDAVIVGRGTFESDNPSLKSRTEEYTDEADYLTRNQVLMSGNDNIVIRYVLNGSYNHAKKSPLRVLAGLPSNITGREKFFDDDNYIIFAAEHKVDKKKTLICEMLEKKKLILCGDGDSFNDTMMSELNSRGMMWVMLEGGADTASRMLGFIDEYLSFIAPKMIGGGRSVFSGEGLGRMADSYMIDEVTSAFLDGDVLYHGYRRL